MMMGWTGKETGMVKGVDMEGDGDGEGGGQGRRQGW